VKRASRKAVETLEIAKEGLAESLREVPKETSERLIRQVGDLLQEQIQQERGRCATACRQRSELWRRTTASQVPASEGREEARARANEALYLADLLASGGDPGQAGPAPDRSTGPLPRPS